MTSAIRMSDNYYDNSGARPDKGGGGGLRGTPAVPLPLPAPSQPLMPSVAQGVSCSTGGDAHREGAPPGTSAPTPPTPPTTPSTPTPPTSPPLMPSVAQGVSFSTGGEAHRGGASTPTPIPKTPSPSTPPTSPPSPTPPTSPPSPTPPTNPSLLPLGNCPEPLFCVGGRDHRRFLAPGGSQPSREQVEWATLRWVLKQFLLLHVTT